ncbi:hypothetical protein PENSPDRAFT_671789 [Peniophora sp. CONT]|nr:hypothetical protein PENSPDRAFT_671789 [Peniophora sp. CONT]
MNMQKGMVEKEKATATLQPARKNDNEEPGRVLASAYSIINETTMGRDRGDEKKPNPEKADCPRIDPKQTKTSPRSKFALASSGVVNLNHNIRTAAKRGGKILRSRVMYSSTVLPRRKSEGIVGTGPDGIIHILIAKQLFLTPSAIVIVVKGLVCHELHAVGVLYFLIGKGGCVNLSRVTQASMEDRSACTGTSREGVNEATYPVVMRLSLYSDARESAYRLFTNKEAKTDQKLSQRVAQLEKLAADARPLLRTESYFFRDLPWTTGVCASSDSLVATLSTEEGVDFTESHPALHVRIPAILGVLDAHTPQSLASWLDIWEKDYVYGPNSDAVPLFRRMGIEKKPPARADDFYLMGQYTSLTWTDSHQWLIMYRLLDVLAFVLLADGLRPPHKRVKTNYHGITRLFGGPKEGRKKAPALSRGWMKHLGDWAGMASAQKQAAMELPESATPGSSTSPGSRQMIEAGGERASQIPPSTSRETSPSAPNGMPAPSPSPATQTSPKATSSALIVPAVSIQEMAIAFTPLSRSIEKSDGRSNKIQRTQAGKRFSLGDITKESAWAINASHAYSSLLISLFISPIFMLMHGLMTSTPVFADYAFQYWKDAGNDNRPAAIIAFERKLWVLVLQVACGLDSLQGLTALLRAEEFDLNDVLDSRDWFQSFGMTCKIAPNFLRPSAERIAAPAAGQIEEVAHQTRRRTREKTAQPAPSSAEEQEQQAAWNFTYRMVKEEQIDVVMDVDDPEEGAHEAGDKAIGFAGLARYIGYHLSMPETNKREFGGGESPPTKASKSSVTDDAASSSRNKDAPKGNMKPPKARKPTRDAGKSKTKQNKTDKKTAKGSTPSTDTGKGRGGGGRGKDGTSPESKDASDLEEASDKSAETSDALERRKAQMLEPITLPYIDRDEPEVSSVKKLTYTPLQPETGATLRSIIASLRRSGQILPSGHYSPFYLQPPARLSDPAAVQKHQSSVFVTDSETASRLTSENLKDIFRERHILIQGSPDSYPQYGWDLDTLARIHPRDFSSQIEVQDNKLPMRDSDGNATAWNKWITMTELLAAGSTGGDNVYNALSLPTRGAHLVHLPIVHDHPDFDISTTLLRQAEPSIGERHVPSVFSRFRWSLAATVNAASDWHIDTGGASTIITMLHGEKVWMVGRDSRRQQFTNSVSCLDPVKDQLPAPDDESEGEESEEDIDALADNQMEWDCIHLKKGDTFFMRAGTPHAVITLASAVVYGQYAITTGTISAAVSSFTVTCLANKTVTNDTFEENLFLLQSLANWWWQHAIDPSSEQIIPYVKNLAPNVERDEDLGDLLAVLAIIVYGPVYSRKRVSRRDWLAAERLHEYIAQRGGVTFHSDIVLLDGNESAIDTIKAIMIHFGRALLDFHARLETRVSDKDVSSAFFKGVPSRVESSLKKAYGATASLLGDEGSKLPPLPPRTPFLPRCSLRPVIGPLPVDIKFSFSS